MPSPSAMSRCTRIKIKNLYFSHNMAIFTLYFSHFMAEISLNNNHFMVIFKIYEGKMPWKES